MRMEKSRVSEREEQCSIWKERLEEWKASGLSQVEYCRKKGLSLKGFRYRKRTLLAERTTVSLIEVPMPSASPPAPLRLLIGSAYHIEIEPGFDAHTLHRLLEVLEG